MVKLEKKPETKPKKPQENCIKQIFPSPECLKQAIVNRH